MKKLIKDRFTIMIILALLFAGCGYVCARYGVHNYEEIKVNYEEQSTIDYKVFLNENPYFDEYLEMNETYIASLIDYIDIDFDYDIKFSEKMSGQYTYYIKGVISADKSNGDSGKYWSKEYILTEKTNIEYNNAQKIAIADEVSINYQEYNQILTDFKNEYGLAIDGNLKIMLVVNNKISNEKLDRDIAKDSDVALNIPLTSQTIEVPIEADGVTNKGSLVDEKIYKEGIWYKVSEIASYCFFSFSLISLLYIVIYEIKNEGLYQRKLRKILKTYDGILVEVSSLPTLNNFNVIKVKNFEELIDAHSEVRRPINFVQKISGVKFLLISEGIAWIYSLDRKVFNEEKNNAE